MADYSLTGIFGLASKQDIADLLTSVTTQVSALSAKVDAMSGTLEAQLQALTTSLAADMQTLSTDLANIIAQLQPGATITAADIAALQAVKTAADNLVTTAAAAP